MYIFIYGIPAGRVGKRCAEHRRVFVPSVGSLVFQILVEPAAVVKADELCGCKECECRTSMDGREGILRGGNDEEAA